MTDNVIAQGLRQKDEESFSILIEKYGAYVATIISNISGESLRREDKEELSADVFVAVWKNADKIKTGVPLKPYIATIARNAAISRLRGIRATVPIDDDILIYSTDKQPEETIVINEQRELINEAVGNLTEPDKEIFIRFYFYGESLKLIGDRLALNIATIKTKLHRARNKIKSLFEMRGYRDEKEN